MFDYSSKNTRLRNYDYHSGWFFVTNTSDFRKNYFVGELRLLVRNELIALAKVTDGVGIDYFQIMPNHIHAILVFENANISLSEFWRRYKAITTYKAKRIDFQGKSLWQRNYYEHVIRSEQALDKIREYIQNNPLKENLPLQEVYGEIV